jgi:hypothetical protein
MADTKISALSNAAALGGTEQLPGVQSAASVNITPAQIKTYVSASPTLVTPTLGVAAATSINKYTFTAPATGSTLTIVDGKTLTASNSLTLAGTDATTMTFPGTSQTIPGLGQANVFTANGALSSGTGPAFTANGTWITGGTATTTKPYFLIETTGATSSGWSTNGTGLGINAASGFVGNLIDAKINSTNRFSVDQFGAVSITSGYGTSSSGIVVYGPAVFLLQRGAGNWQLGNADAASPVSQILTAQGSRSGTDTNAAGGDLTVQSGRGTGTAAISSLVLQSPVAVASGTGAQTFTTGATIKNGVTVLPTYTVATLPTASTVSGGRANVSDALTPTFGSAVTGGGAVFTPVYSNGSAWFVG